MKFWVQTPEILLFLLISKYDEKWGINHIDPFPFRDHRTRLPNVLQTKALIRPFASRLSVTKAGDLSDTPGAERSTGGGSGDIMTLSPRLMLALFLNNDWTVQCKMVKMYTDMAKTFMNYIMAKSRLNLIKIWDPSIPVVFKKPYHYHIRLIWIY